MEQNFSLLAQSRANYYTKGSPVQFVRVELLKGDVTGEVAVCLTFKNVAPQPLAGLVVRFKCKNPSGALLCEGEYDYGELAAAQGDLFGADDAVYICDGAIGSVEVDLDHALLPDGSVLELGGYKRVRLPAPKALPPQLAQALSQRVGKDGLTVMPQMLDEGWYCACGAFHPAEEDSVYCSECGCDRILLQNSLSTLLQGGQRPAAADEPTRVVSDLRPEEPTRMMPRGLGAQAQPHRARGAAPLDEEDEWQDGEGGEGGSTGSFDPYGEDGEDYDDGYDLYDPDETAEKIIRWAPPITAGLCALVVAIGFMWYRFML